MRVLRFINSVSKDIPLSIGELLMWTLILSFLADTGFAACVPDKLVHDPGLNSILNTMLIVEGAVIGILFIMWVSDSPTRYFKEKWEQTKTSGSDKDTLLRGSKERA